MYFKFRLIVIAIISVLILFLVVIKNFSQNEIETYEITIKDHVFYPDILEIPQNKKIRLIISNKDDTIEEFESLDLRRERIIPPMKETSIIIGPLNSGKYSYMGEFHQETAKGLILVK